MEDMTLKTLLKNVALFEGLPEEDLQRLERIGRSKSLAKGEILFAQGEEATGFYVVAKGRVKVYRLSPKGRQQILHVLGPGEALAEVALFSDARYPAWAEALEPSEVIFFPRKAFLDLVQRRPELALNILGLMALRLRKLASMVEALALKEVPERLASYLLYLKEIKGSPEFELEIPKGELAALLGTVPETLSRVLTRLSEKGLLQISGRKIRILDEEGLRRLERS